jgi:hypothetical protein
VKDLITANALICNLDSRVSISECLAYILVYKRILQNFGLSLLNNIVMCHDVVGMSIIGEVSHQYEYDNDTSSNLSFSFSFSLIHIKRVSTESRRKSRLDSKGYLHPSGINPWSICICSDSKELK